MKESSALSLMPAMCPQESTTFSARDNSRASWRCGHPRRVASTHFVGHAKVEAPDPGFPHSLPL